MATYQATQRTAWPVLVKTALWGIKTRNQAENYIAWFLFWSVLFLIWSVWLSLALIGLAAGMAIAVRWVDAHGAWF
jgi:hypothetical protein